MQASTYTENKQNKTFLKRVLPRVIRNVVPGLRKHYCYMEMYGRVFNLYEEVKHVKLEYAFTFT